MSCVGVVRGRVAAPASNPTALVAALLAVLLAALLAALPACSSDDSPRAASPPGGAAAPTMAPTTEVTSYRPRLRPASCAETHSNGGGDTCWVLVVPEDRSEPGARQVELPVIRQAPASGDTAAPPIVVLHGGPGGGAVTEAVLWRSVIGDPGREVVLYDQRGGGMATPRLDCPEHAAAFGAALSDPGARAVDRRTVEEALRSCHDRLTAEGVALDAYDTPASTADLDDLRVTLGADRMTLVATSYGSRLALDYLRSHPERVSSLVLDGVDPPDQLGNRAISELAAEAVERLIAACEADAGCAGRRPRLGDALEDALESFDRTPQRIDVPVPNGGERPVAIDGDDLYAGLFAALYDTEIVPLLPSLVDAVARGDSSVVDAFASRALTTTASTAMGAFMSVECADAASTGTAEPGGRAATLELTGSLALCGAWPVEPVSEAFRRPVTPSEAVPALVVAGSLDPITPAADAREVAERLGATLFEVPRGGHAPLRQDACGIQVLNWFLRSDGTGERPGCIERARPQPFR
jgi:pimeloyl-ACP methyl ester carboxylesterase